MSEQLYDSDRRDRPVLDSLGRLRRHRELLGLLVLRDLTVRYKRSLLGIWWTLLNPLLTTAVMYVVFSAVFRFQVPGVPFAVYLLSGVLLVTFFSQGLLAAGGSIRNAAPVLTKVAVAAEVFPVAAVLGALVNLVIGLVLLLGLQLLTGVGIPLTAPLVVVPLLALTALVLGLGLVVATTSVRFEDVLPTLGVLLTVLSYATPTFYPLNIVPDRYLPVLALNPLVHYLEVFRALLYDGSFGDWQSWTVVVLSAVLALLWGLVSFSRSWRSTAVRL